MNDENKKMAMEEGKQNANPVPSKEVSLGDLDQVLGGTNPFAKYARVDDQKIDESIKDKV